MKGWRLACEIFVWRIGAGNAATCLVLLLTAGGAAWHLASLNDRVSHVQAEFVVGRARAAEPAKPAVSPAGDGQRLAEFERTLGTRSDLDQYLRSIFSAARQRGVALTIGEYRLAVDNPGRFQRYEVLLPVEGSFSSIQQLSQQILIALPFAALEDVSLRREAVDKTAVQARLRFVFFLSPDEMRGTKAPAQTAEAPR